jgi:glucosylceramidase
MRFCTTVFATVLLSALLSSVHSAGETVHAWITTTTDSWVERGLEPADSAAFSDDTVAAPFTEIAVNDRIRFQQWEGAGASFTDAAAWLIDSVVKPELRDSVMTALFDRKKGIGVSYLRNPMGSSDLTVSRYTYDDNPADRADSTLPHFSIDHDRADVLPLTKQARRLNPALTLQMNAWSPPAWMKSNNSLVAGEILPTYYAHHANYYIKTIKAYEAESVHVDYVTLNNEPSCCDSIDYPSVAVMGAEAMRAMLKGYWLPMFAAQKLTTKILLLDFNANFLNMVQPFLNDPVIQSSPIIGGVAFHGYGGDPALQTEVFDQYGYNIYFTEWSGFTDGRAQHEADMRKIVSVIRNYAKSFVKWPVATDENFGPHMGGCSGCRGLIRVWRFDQQKKGTVDYRIDYYDMGHLTKFVENGAWRIHSTYNTKLLNVAFVNPDKSIALLVFNDTLEDRRIKVVWGGQAFSYLVPSKASITFAWTPSTAAREPYSSGDGAERSISIRQVRGGFAVSAAGMKGLSLEILDLRGRVLARREFEGTAAFIDKRGFPPGMYLIRAGCGANVRQKRVLVTK